MLKKIFKGLIIFIVAIFLVGGGFGAGLWFGKGGGRTPETPGGLLKLVTATQPSDLDFSLFWEAWRLVDKNYIGKKDTEKRTEGAIQGMIGGLDDPYSVYLEPSANEIFLSDLEGHFDGIGAELSVKNGLITVVAPLEGSPAEKAGLKAQDVILKVNGEETNKMSFSDVILKIRGKKGTEVILTIYREGEKEEREIKVIRDVIEVKSVSLNYASDNTPILKINQFGKDTVSLLKEAGKTISDKKSDRLIIDLRNNPGGLLDAAVDVASLFLPDDLSSYQEKSLSSGVIVSEEEKNSKKQNFLRTNKQLFDQRIVIIQNGGSASASEIFAGAIKDYGLGKIVGTKSFGKGSVQNLFSLSNKGSVKVTIARWLTPKGSQINGVGIEPDVIIKDGEENEESYINKAIEILNQ